MYPVFFVDTNIITAFRLNKLLDEKFKQKNDLIVFCNQNNDKYYFDYTSR